MDIRNKAHLFFIFFEWKNNIVEQSFLLYTTNPWSIGAGLCGVFLTLHKAYSLLRASVKKVKKEKEKIKSQRQSEPMNWNVLKYLADRTLHVKNTANGQSDQLCHTKCLNTCHMSSPACHSHCVSCNSENHPHIMSCAMCNKHDVTCCAQGNASVLKDTSYHSRKNAAICQGQKCCK